MPLISLSMALLMGLCLYAGMHFLLYYNNSRKTHSANTLYLLFSGMCFVIIGHMAAELMTYQSQDAAAYVVAAKWRLVFSLLFLMAWPWFVYRYTGSGPRWLVAGLSTYMGLHLLFNIFRPYSAVFDELPMLTRQIMPWGETISFHTHSHLNLQAGLAWAAILVIVAYTFHACFRQFQRGQRHPAITLAIAMAIFIAFLFENLLVLAGKLNFIFLAQYGFPALVVIMAAALQREAHTQAWRVQAIVDHVPAVVYLKNPDGRYLMVNRQYESLFRVTNAGVLGKTDFDLFDQAQAQASDARDREVLAGDRAMEFEETLRHADSTPHTYHSILFPVHDTNNEPYALCGISSDVTERRQAQQHIAQSEAKFRTLFETAGDAILLMHGDRFIDCNPQSLTLFGCRREDIVGNTPLAFSPPSQYDGRDSSVAAQEHIEAAMAGSNQVFPWRHCRLDGSLFDAEVNLVRIELDGQPCLQAIVRDVTSRKRNEEAIKNIAAGVSSATGEAFFRQLVLYLAKLFDTKYAFIGLLDEKDPQLINTLAVSADGAIADNISYRLEHTPCANVVGKGACAHPSHVQQAFPQDLLLQQMGVESYIGTPLFDSLGKPLGLIVLLDDKPLQHIEWTQEILQIFAARAGAELERVRAEHDLYIKDRAMEAATEGILLIAAAGDNAIVYANQAMERITGYSRDELLGKNPRLLQGPDTDPASVDQLREAVSQCQPCQVEILNYRKDGSPFWNEITLTPVRNEAGEVSHFIGTQLDITQRRHTEEALRRSQKMEAVGQLAGGVAHDFNNQLGVIIGYLDFLHARLAADDKPRQWVETATQATLRCVDLTRQLLAFSRRQTKETTISDLNQELVKMDTLIARSVTPAISVQTFLGGGLWPVAIDPGEFQDAILNLVINARDAMPEGGQLLIETSNKLVDAHYGELNPELTPGDYVQVMVSDTGDGMDKATLERIFEPFFTTKPEGKGTGLGLAMVYGFAKRYDGEIKVYSEPGLGTTFRLYLPRAVETAKLAFLAEAESSALPTGRETILIVDDEEDLLQLAEQYLKPLGYRTFTAHNPAEALKLLAQQPDIELLFSDVVMPGDTNGYTLAEQAVKLLPGLKVLLTSGFTANTIASSGQGQFAAQLLHKPYRREDLARRIRSVLDEEEA